MKRKDVPEISITMPSSQLTGTPFTLHHSYDQILNTKLLNKNIRNSKFVEKNYAVKYSENIGQIVTSENGSLAITSHREAIRAWNIIEGEEENTNPLWTFANQGLKFYDKKLWIKDNLVICAGYTYKGMTRETIIFILDVHTGKDLLTISNHKALEIIEEAKIIPDTIIVDHHHLIYKLSTGIIIKRNLNSLSEDFMHYNNMPIASSNDHNTLLANNEKIIDITQVLEGEIIKNFTTKITMIEKENEYLRPVTLSFNGSLSHPLLLNHLLICQYNAHDYLVIDIDKEKVIYDKGKEFNIYKSNITDPFYQAVFNHPHAEKILDLAVHGNQAAVAYIMELAGNLHSIVRVKLFSKIGDKVTEKEIENLHFNRSESPYAVNFSLAFNNEGYLTIHTKQSKTLTRGCNLSLISIKNGEKIKEKDLKKAVNSNTPVLIKEAPKQYDLILLYIKAGETPYQYLLDKAKRDNTPVLIMEATGHSVRFKFFSAPTASDVWDFYEFGDLSAQFSNLDQLPFNQKKEVILKREQFPQALIDGLKAKQYHTENKPLYKIYGSPDGLYWKFYDINHETAASLKLNSIPFAAHQIERKDKYFTQELISTLRQAHYCAEDITYKVEENSLYIWHHHELNTQLKKMDIDHLNHHTMTNGILLIANANTLISKDFKPQNKVNLSNKLNNNM